MNTQEIQAVGALCVLAAMADGEMSEREREHVRTAFEGLGEGEEARALAAAYRRTMLGQTSVEQEARAITTPQVRRYAFEMAVAVCDANGHHGEAETKFLEGLRVALGLDAEESAALVEQADEIVDLGLDSPAPARGTFAGAAAGAATGVMTATAASSTASEVDASILRYSILNGALELLPQGLATMAIVPLQMKMVYAVGKAHGISLDRGHVKELIATVGVGMTSQVVEGFVRDLLGGFARKLLGKTAGRAVRATTGAAMTFATTYALGQVAKQYYAGGRRLSAVDLRGLFAREVERAKGLYEQHRPQVEAQARTVDPRQLLSMVRGA